MLNKRFIINYTPLFSKRFSSQIHPDIVDKFTKIKDFKSIINEVLESKVFHFAILRYDVKELVCLQKETGNHLKDLGLVSRKYKISLQPNRLNRVSSKLMILSTLSLTYPDFLEFIKVSHERLEEEINDLIRISLEYDQFSQDESMKSLLKCFRDRWRECLSPEVLDQNKQPLSSSSTISQLIISLNNNLFRLLI